MSTAYLVLTALGPDRPGLVAELTQFLTSRGANVEESRMAILGAEFGMLVLVSAPDDDVLTAIEADLAAVQKKSGLTIHPRRTRSPHDYRRARVVPCSIVVEALDQPGIVHNVTAAVHALGINIVSLETTAFNAPFTGGILFMLEARVDVPEGRTVAQLRKTLAELADKEGLDVEVRSLASASG